MLEIKTCAIPADSPINAFIDEGPVKFAGAMSTSLPDSVRITAVDLARATFSRPTISQVDENSRKATFFNRISKSWQRPVDPYPDVTEMRAGERFGFWQVYDVRPHEVLVGNEDPLMSYRVMFRVTPEGTAVIASATRCRNIGGRAWWFLFGGYQQRLLKTALFNGVSIGAAKVAGHDEQ